MAQDEIMPFPVVAIGGSAGSLEIVLALAKKLPLNTGAIYIIVLHRRSQESVLDELLAHNTKLRVIEVEDKDAIEPGIVYLAPPDYHLLVEADGRSFSLDTSPRVHYSRPSIDVAFDSIAEVFGNRVLGILLSGANADGAEGLLKIKDAGGHTIAQDPLTADVSVMPQQAINLHAADEVLAPSQLSEAINSFLRR